MCLPSVLCSIFKTSAESGESFPSETLESCRGHTSKPAGASVGSRRGGAAARGLRRSKHITKAARHTTTTYDGMGCDATCVHVCMCSLHCWLLAPPVHVARPLSPRARAGLLEPLSTQSLDAHKRHRERRHRAKTLSICSSTYVVKKKQASTDRLSFNYIYWIYSLKYGRVGT